MKPFYKMILSVAIGTIVTTETIHAQVVSDSAKVVLANEKEQREKDKKAEKQANDILKAEKKVADKDEAVKKSTSQFG
ncbi:MAG: hypothetical protein JNM51_14200 [Bacteroidia bacterium]|nr:hypothetical protein [Bacteroidia bacterium]